MLGQVQDIEPPLPLIDYYGYELGIIEGRCDDNRLMQEVWCRDHLVIVAAPTHPYANYKAVSFAQLQHIPCTLSCEGRKNGA